MLPVDNKDATWNIPPNPEERNFQSLPSHKHRALLALKHSIAMMLQRISEKDPGTTAVLPSLAVVDKVGKAVGSF